MKDSADPIINLKCLQGFLDQQDDLVWSADFPDLLIDNQFPAGKLRYRVGLVEDGKILSFAQVQYADVFGLEIPELYLAYAVIETHRNRGLGQRTVRHLLEALRAYLASISVEQFALMAVIDHANLPSRAVIERFVHTAPVEKIDGDTGLPALLYASLIELP